MKIQTEKIICSKDSASKSSPRRDEWHISFNISHDFSCSASSNGATGNGNKVALLDPGSPQGHVNSLAAPEQ